MDSQTLVPRTQLHFIHGGFSPLPAEDPTEYSRVAPSAGRRLCGVHADSAQWRCTDPPGPRDEAAPAR